MKKILFITPYTPSNKDAGSNYTKQLLNQLSNKHCIDLIYFYYKTDETYKPLCPQISIVKSIRNNKLYKIINLILFPFLFPLFTVRFNWILYIYIRSLIKKNNYDVIYFDFSQTFLYARLLKHPCKILMSHDVIFQRYEREQSLLLEWIKTCEKWLLKTKNAHIFTFSKKDNAIIKAQYNLKAKETNFFLPIDVQSSKPDNVGNYFVLFAMWKRPDNYNSIIWLINNVFPNISVNIKIIGGGMPKNILNTLSSFTNIEYLGFIENPYPLISNAKALLAPIFSGAGVKVKVIETLACGTPVIGTDIAFEGISDSYSDFMLLANTPDGFSSMINSINKTMEEKKAFKEKFINTYTQYPIVNFISNL